MKAYAVVFDRQNEIARYTFGELTHLPGADYKPPEFIYPQSGKPLNFSGLRFQVSSSGQEVHVFLLYRLR